jgi:hypothetical protein
MRYRSTGVKPGSLSDDFQESAVTIARRPFERQRPCNDSIGPRRFVAV